MNPKLFQCLPIILAVTVTACDSSLTAPASVAGTYVARQLDGVAFPWTSVDRGIIVRWEADTLRLVADGTFERLEVSGIESESGDLRLTRKVRRGLFFVRGDDLTLQFSCTSGADGAAQCSPNREGTVVGTKLRLRHADSELLYELTQGS